MGSEVWKNVVGFEDVYEVSNLGRIRSLVRKEPRIMSPCPVGKGEHVRIGFAVGEGRKLYRPVSHVVMEAFGEDRPEGATEVAHKNGDARDNQIGNLRWAVQQTNTLRDTMRRGGDNHHNHQHPERLSNGAAHYATPLTEEQVREIRRDYRPRSGVVLAAKYGVTPGTIANIVARRTWKHVV